MPEKADRVDALIAIARGVQTSLPRTPVLLPNDATMRLSVSNFYVPTIAAVNDVGELDAMFEGAMGPRLYELAFRTTPVGMAFMTPDRRTVRVNPALCDFLGRTPDELINIDLAELTHPTDAALHIHPHRRLVAGEINRYALDKRYLHKDGRTIWGHLQVGLIRDEAGAPQMVVSQVLDITERKAYTDQLHWHATHDSLTGFANRPELFARLRDSLRRARFGVAAAVLYLDLDGFKDINDRYGHATGDRVLQYMAASLAGMLRADDTAARIGGDEFVLITAADDAMQAVALAERVLSTVGKGFVTEGQTIALSVSIGIALAHGGDSESVLQRADTALYAAKRVGKNRYVVAD